MSKGELTRAAILEHAMSMASRYGLEGLTIGQLADELDLSKSGLFAHFRSKEALQVQLLEYVAAQFIERVVKPALAAPRGVERLEALFDHWLRWTRWKPMPGGCLFVAAATELDDRPGPVRDRLVELQRSWLGFLTGAARIAIEEGEFASDADPELFGHELYGVMLTYHHANRLLRDPKAESRARMSFQKLIESARPSRRMSQRRVAKVV